METSIHITRTERVDDISAAYPILKCLERHLAIWATRKYKRLRHHKRRAAQWLNCIARKLPNLFAHWKMLYATAGR